MLKYLAFLLLVGHPAVAQTAEGVLVRCGASSGHAYFLKHEFWNPEGPSWQEDGLSKGKIILVRLGDEWDIQFDDIIGSSGYRQDGARVFPVLTSEDLLTIGAFHENYADLYTFDLKNREVIWSSNKHGPVGPKVAVYRADCEEPLR